MSELNRRQFCGSVASLFPVSVISAGSKTGDSDQKPEPQRFRIYAIGSEDSLATNSDINAAQNAISTFVQVYQKAPTAEEVSERIHLPVRFEEIVKHDGNLMIVKLGTEDRPAMAVDIQEFQEILAQVAKDPNLTIVTHHAVEFFMVPSKPMETTFVIAANCDNISIKV